MAIAIDKYFRHLSFFSNVSGVSDPSNDCHGNHTCSQLCLPKSRVLGRCVCTAGFSLSKDNSRDCEGITMCAVKYCCNGEFYKFCILFGYCESILFRGAEISSFEDDRHIRGFLTSWIALPTKLKNTKLLPSILTGAKLRHNTETGSIAKLGISEWLCLLSYVTPEDIDPRQLVYVFTAESHQTTFMTPNCQLACHLRDYIHKDVRGAGSFKGLI